MKIFSGDRYELRPVEGGPVAAHGLTALDDGVDIVVTEPAHLDPIPPGGEYPRRPKCEAFHWLNTMYDDRNSRSVELVARHFGFNAAPIKDDLIQEGDKVAAYGFSRDEAERNWLDGAQGQGWQAFPAPGTERLILEEVDQARPRPNRSVWRASATVAATFRPA